MRKQEKDQTVVDLKMIVNDIVFDPVGDAWIATKDARILHGSLGKGDSLEMREVDLVRAKAGEASPNHLSKARAPKKQFYSRFVPSDGCQVDITGLTVKALKIDAIKTNIWLDHSRSVVFELHDNNVSSKFKFMVDPEPVGPQKSEQEPAEKEGQTSNEFKSDFSCKYTMFWDAGKSTLSLYVNGVKSHSTTAAKPGYFAIIPSAVNSVFTLNPFKVFYPNFGHDFKTLPVVAELDTSFAQTGKVLDQLCQDGWLIHNCVVSEDSKFAAGFSSHDALEILTKIQKRVSKHFVVADFDTFCSRTDLPQGMADFAKANKEVLTTKHTLTPPEAHQLTEQLEQAAAFDESLFSREEGSLTVSYIQSTDSLLLCGQASAKILKRKAGQLQVQPNALDDTVTQLDQTTSLCFDARDAQNLLQVLRGFKQPKDLPDLQYGRHAQQLLDQINALLTRNHKSLIVSDKFSHLLLAVEGLINHLLRELNINPTPGVGEGRVSSGAAATDAEPEGNCDDHTAINNLFDGPTDQKEPVVEERQKSQVEEVKVRHFYAARILFEAFEQLQAKAIYLSDKSQQKIGRAFSTYYRLASFCLTRFNGKDFIELARNGIYNNYNTYYQLRHFLHENFPLSEIDAADFRNHSVFEILSHNGFESKAQLELLNVSLSDFVNFMPKVTFDSNIVASAVDEKSGKVLLLLESGEAYLFDTSIGLVKNYAGNLRDESHKKRPHAKIIEKKAKMVVNLEGTISEKVFEAIATKKDTPADEIEPDPVKLDTLYNMGFSIELARKALIKTKNQSVDVAIEAIIGLQEELNANPDDTPLDTAVSLIKPVWQCAACTLFNETAEMDPKDFCTACMSPAPIEAYYTKEEIDGMREDQKKMLQAASEKEILLMKELEVEPQKETGLLANFKGSVAGISVSSLDVNHLSRTIIAAAFNLDQQTSVLRIRRLGYSADYLRSLLREEVEANMQITLFNIGNEPIVDCDKIAEERILSEYIRDGNALQMDALIPAFCYEPAILENLDQVDLQLEGTILAVHILQNTAIQRQPQTGASASAERTEDFEAKTVLLLVLNANSQVELRSYRLACKVYDFHAPKTALELLETHTLDVSFPQASLASFLCDTATEVLVFVADRIQTLSLQGFNKVSEFSVPTSVKRVKQVGGKTLLIDQLGNASELNLHANSQLSVQKDTAATAKNQVLTCDDILNFLHQKKYTSFRTTNHSTSPIIWSDNSQSSYTYQSILITSPATPKISYSIQTKERDVKNAIINLVFNFRVAGLQQQHENTLSTSGQVTNSSVFGLEKAEEENFIPLNIVHQSFANQNSTNMLGSALFNNTQYFTAKKAGLNFVFFENQYQLDMRIKQISLYSNETDASDFIENALVFTTNSIGVAHRFDLRSLGKQMKYQEWQADKAKRQEKWEEFEPVGFLSLFKDKKVVGALDHVRIARYFCLVFSADNNKKAFFNVNFIGVKGSVFPANSRNSADYLRNTGENMDTGYCLTLTNDEKEVVSNKKIFLECDKTPNPTAVININSFEEIGELTFDIQTANPAAQLESVIVHIIKCGSNNDNGLKEIFENREKRIELLQHQSRQLSSDEVSTDEKSKIFEILIDMVANFDPKNAFDIHEVIDVDYLINKMILKNPDSHLLTSISSLFEKFLHIDQFMTRVMDVLRSTLEKIEEIETNLDSLKNFFKLLDSLLLNPKFAPLLTFLQELVSRTIINLKVSNTRDNKLLRNAGITSNPLDLTSFWTLSTSANTAVSSEEFNDFWSVDYLVVKSVTHIDLYCDLKREVYMNRMLLKLVDIAKPNPDVLCFASLYKCDLENGSWDYARENLLFTKEVSPSFLFYTNKLSREATLHFYNASMFNAIGYRLDQVVGRYFKIRLTFDSSKYTKAFYKVNKHKLLPHFYGPSGEQVQGEVKANLPSVEKNVTAKITLGETLTFFGTLKNKDLKPSSQASKDSSATPAAITEAQAEAKPEPAAASVEAVPDSSLNVLRECLANERGDRIRPSELASIKEIVASLTKSREEQKDSKKNTVGMNSFNFWLCLLDLAGGSQHINKNPIQITFEHIESIFENIFLSHNEPKIQEICFNIIRAFFEKETPANIFKLLKKLLGHLSSVDKVPQVISKKTISTVFELFGKTNSLQIYKLVDYILMKLCRKFEENRAQYLIQMNWCFDLLFLFTEPISKSEELPEESIGATVVDILYSNLDILIWVYEQDKIGAVDKQLIGGKAIQLFNQIFRQNKTRLNQKFSVKKQVFETLLARSFQLKTFLAVESIFDSIVSLGEQKESESAVKQMNEIFTTILTQTVNHMKGEQTGSPNTVSDILKNQTIEEQRFLEFLCFLIKNSYQLSKKLAEKPEEVKEGGESPQARAPIRKKLTAEEIVVNRSLSISSQNKDKPEDDSSTIRDLLSLYASKHRLGTSNPNLLIEISKLIFTKNISKEYLKLFFDLYQLHRLEEKTLITNEILAILSDAIETLKKVKAPETDFVVLRDFCSGLLDSLVELINSTGLEHIDIEFAKLVLFVQETIIGPETKKGMNAVIKTLITPLSLTCVANIFFLSAKELNRLCNWGGPDGYDSLEKDRITPLEIILNFLSIVTVATSNTKAVILSEIATNLKSVNLEKVSNAVHQIIEWNVFNNIPTSKKSPAMDRLNKITACMNQILQGLSEYPEAGKIIIKRLFEVVNEVHGYLMPKINSGEINFIGINFIYNLFGFLEKILDWTLKDNYMVSYFIVECKGIHFIFDLLNISYESSTVEADLQMQNVENILNNLLSGSHADLPELVLAVAPAPVQSIEKTPTGPKLTALPVTPSPGLNLMQTQPLLPNNNPFLATPTPNPTSTNAAFLFNSVAGATPNPTTATPAQPQPAQPQQVTNLSNFKNNIPCNNPDKYSEEFAKEMKCLNKLNGKEEKTLDWQKNKKGGGKQIIFYHLQNDNTKNNREMILEFSLTGPVDLRTIKAAFLTSYNDYGNKVVAEPAYVHIHYKAKESDEWRYLCQLDRYEDNGYFQGASMCYQKNFMRTEGSSFKERIDSVCIPKRVEFLRFVVGKPNLSFQENLSQLRTKEYNQLIIAPSFISVLGINSNQYSLQVQNNFIKETTLLRLIQRVFSKDQKSLESISNQPDLIDRFKIIFERLVDDYVDHFTSPLVSFSRNNKEFGLWVMNKLLDLKYKDEHAKVVGEIVMSTVDQYQERISILCDFIIGQIETVSGPQQDRLFSFMAVFASCFHRSPNDHVFAEKFTLNIDTKELNLLVTYFTKISYVQQFKSFFITLVYSPNAAFKLKIDHPMDYLMEKLSTAIRKDTEFVLAELISLFALSRKVYADRILEENIIDFLFKQFDKMDPKGLISVLLFFRNIINHEVCKKKIIDIKLPEKLFKKLKSLATKDQSNHPRVLSSVILGLDIIKNIISTDSPSAAKFSSLLLETCSSKSANESADDANCFLETIFFPILFTIKTHKVFFEKKVATKPALIPYDDAVKEVKEDLVFKLASQYIPADYHSTLLSNLDVLTDNSTKDKFKNGKWDLIGSTQKLSSQELAQAIDENLIGQGSFMLLIDGEAGSQEFVLGIFCSSGLPKDPKMNPANKEISVSNSDNHFIFLYEKSDKPNPVSCHYKTKSVNDSELFLKYSDKPEGDRGIMIYYTNLEKIFVSFNDLNSSHIDLYPMKCLETDPQPQYEFPFDFRIKRGVEIWKLSQVEAEAPSKDVKVSSMFMMTPLNLKNELLNISYSYYRDSTVYNIPNSITLENLKKVFFGEDAIQFKYSKTDTAIDQSKNFDEIKKENKPIDELDIIDIEYNKNTDVKASVLLTDLKDHYTPQTPILDHFVTNKGMDEVLAACSNMLQTNPNWVGKQFTPAWEQIIYEINLFKKIEFKEANFMLNFAEHHSSIQVLFKIIFGISGYTGSDKQLQPFEETVVASIYQSLGQLLKEAKDPKLRDFIISSGIFEKILDRLQSISKETKRKFVEEDDKPDSEDKKDTKKKEEDQKGGIIKRKGVGYEGVSNTNWSTEEFFKLNEAKNKRIQALLNIIINSLDIQGWKAPEGTLNIICESCLLPLIENAFRCTSLIDIGKERKLYELYLNICKALARTESLIPALVELDKKFKPNQINSIEYLLKQLAKGAETFKKLSSDDSADKRVMDENTKNATALSEEILKTYDILQTAISGSAVYKDRNTIDIKAIEALPMEQKYRTLLENHRFGYVNMKEQKDATKYIHHYKSNFSGKYAPQPAKMVRLAQEIADLSNSLPVDSTNAMFVRADEERLDVMKAVIFGAEGCPYAHGAFEYHIYCDNEYPNVPPKVNLETTGKGDVRFNPNLYNCGKVCLSLLGTWRGNASENWDPKISTLSQVVVSIQAVVMSEEVYFNEPGYGQEAGTEQGELKNNGYSNIVRLCNVKYGMIGQIENPTKGFENVIRTHFVLKKDIIMKTVKEWNKLAQEKDAIYTGLVADHNPSYCERFKTRPAAYVEELAAETAKLEKLLNSLEQPPIEALLGSKVSNVKIGRDKKDNQAITDGAAKIDDIDMTYDDKEVQHKDMKSDEAGVMDRWSRYIGVMGIESVAKQANSSVFLSGLNSLGVEIAKNIVLSGVKRVTLHDSKNASWNDLSGQFFLSEADIGKNRAAACQNKIQQLNFYVKVDVAAPGQLPESEEEIEKLGIKDYEVVILVDTSHQVIEAVSRLCRKHSRNLIVADCHGIFSRVFCDFGPKFVCFDKNGEEAQEVMISNISNEECGKVTLLEGVKHTFEDGDTIILRNVEGMKLEQTEMTEAKENEPVLDSINGVSFKVKVLNFNSFLIGDTRRFSKYVRGGLAKQIKVPFEICFKPYHEVYSSAEPGFEENLVIHDFMKVGHSQILHLLYLTLTDFEHAHKRLPLAYSIEDAHEFAGLARKKAAALEKLVDLKEAEPQLLKLAYRFCMTLTGNFGPHSAYIGGIVCQEIIKAITGKFKPIYQAFYADSIEVLDESLFPENLPSLSAEQFGPLVEASKVSPSACREDGIRLVIGQSLLEKLKYANLFMVGSGAIGCELLKNYAMISLGTGVADESHQRPGQIILTDPDVIEVSNLNRQFLFREKHLRKPKSVTAAAAAQAMNPQLKGHLLSRLDKVHEGTANIFTDEFFASMTIVTNALDNIQARKYIDARCVTARTPLIESGTLGPKGHVQVIMPNQTESYGSMKDPVEELDIPHCTLKMFPEETLHCVEWARDLFGNLFTQGPQALRKCLEELQEGSLNVQEAKALKDSIKLAKKAPKTFEDSILYARQKFQKYFNYDIKQLLNVYPLDFKDKEGNPFWKLPKRPPTPSDFDPENKLHRDFIAAMAYLHARTFNVAVPEHAATEAIKLEVAKKAAALQMPDFKPSDEKAKEISKDIEKQNSKKTEEMVPEEETAAAPKEDSFEELKKTFAELGQQLKSEDIRPEEFEKDNDQNRHIDIIHAMANLRASNYKLDEMDWITVKIKAGRIVPALATTTAAIAGLQTLEAVKVLKAVKVEHIKNAFLNIAVPILTQSEPGPAPLIKLLEDLTVTLWTRWEVDACLDKTLRDVFDHIEKLYKLFPRDVIQGAKSLYMRALGGAEILTVKLGDLFSAKAGDHEDLTITCSKSETDPSILQGVPPIRLKF